MLPGFEETGPDIVLAEHCKVGNRVDFGRSGLTRKVEHSFERRQFTVDCGVLRALLLPGVDIVSYKLTRHLDGPQDAKERLQVQVPSRL